MNRELRKIRKSLSEPLWLKVVLVLKKRRRSQNLSRRRKMKRNSSKSAMVVVTGTTTATATGTGVTGDAGSHAAGAVLDNTGGELLFGIILRY